MTNDDVVATLAEFSGAISVFRNAKEQGLIVHVATRSTCAEHLAHGDDKATGRLAASPDHVLDRRDRLTALEAVADAARQQIAEADEWRDLDRNEEAVRDTLARLAHLASQDEEPA
jgi:hypothetical protein